MRKDTICINVRGLVEIIMNSCNLILTTNSSKVGKLCQQRYGYKQTCSLVESSKSSHKWIKMRDFPKQPFTNRTSEHLSLRKTESAKIVKISSTNKRLLYSREQAGPCSTKMKITNKSGSKKKNYISKCFKIAVNN